MRVSPLFSLLILAGCAAEAPSSTEQPPRRPGYKTEVRNGVTVYCRTDSTTASHIQTTTICRTAAELDAQDQRNQQDLSSPNRPIKTTKSLIPGGG